MKISSKSLDDEYVEIKVVISKEELHEIAKGDNKTGLPKKSGANLTGIFDTTRYCVICTLTESKHEIDVYGDIAANIKATAICGPGLYRLRDGPC